jgi:hypothetical protein
VVVAITFVFSTVGVEAVLAAVSVVSIDVVIVVILLLLFQ